MRHTLFNVGPRLSFWASWVTATALFLLPVRVTEADSSGLDKVGHFVVLAFLGFLGLVSYGRRPYVVAGLLIIYTFLIEYVQGTYFPFRTLDWHDAVAGSVGVISVLLVKRRK